MNSPIADTPLIEAFSSTAPPARILAKGLALGVLSIIVAGLVLAVLGLVATGGVWIAEQFSWLEPATIVSVRSRLIPVLAFVAVGIGMWSGIYSTTPKGSGITSVVGLIIGGGFGLMLFKLGSPLWSLGMLGVGWAVSIPASSLRTGAIRAIPSVVLGLMTLGIADTSGVGQAVLLVMGAAVAALVVTLMVVIVDPIVERRD